MMFLYQYLMQTGGTDLKIYKSETLLPSLMPNTENCSYAVNVYFAQIKQSADSFRLFE